ncbi:MAG: SDR family oxidoreductase [Acetobacteraceae bacterium]
MLSIITGATGGLGYATAEGLARAGHRVMLTGRSAGRGAEALTRLRAAVPGAEAWFEALDVASLASVEAFARRVEAGGPIDVLVNNAGIMALPERQLTVDGFEQQIGTNYLGHFALTGRLLPLLQQAPRARVVSVSSLAHRKAQMDLDDLQGARRYAPMVAYQRSKLAMLIFARELQRRATRHGWPLVSIAAHPGWSATRIILNGMGQGVRERVLQTVFNTIAQSAAAGARPMLLAALAPDAEPGGYYGPTGPGEVRGPPGPSRVMPPAQDIATAERLWSLSEQLTGVHYG